jgi:RNA 3'-terminal phosphate cyclase (ATP)
VSAQHTEVFTALGEMGRPAEQIAKQLANRVKRYLSAVDATDEYLADQLLLPIALGKGGEFSCRKISEHTRTQAAMIGRSCL